MSINYSIKQLVPGNKKTPFKGLNTINDALRDVELTLQIETLKREKFLTSDYPYSKKEQDRIQSKIDILTEERESIRKKYGF